MRLFLSLLALLGVLHGDEPYIGSTLDASFMWEPTCYHLGFDAPLGDEERLGWIGTLGYCDLYEGKSRFLRKPWHSAVGCSMHTAACFVTASLSQRRYNYSKRISTRSTPMPKGLPTGTSLLYGAVIGGTSNAALPWHSGCTFRMSYLGVASSMHMDRAVTRPSSGC